MQTALNFLSFIFARETEKLIMYVRFVVKLVTNKRQTFDMTTSGVPQNDTKKSEIK